MIDHVSVYVDDIEKAKTFFNTALKPLGYTLTMEFPEWKVAGFGADDKADFWIGTREQVHNSHIAFTAKNKAVVDEFYKAAMAAGAKDNGAPGYRKDYSPGYYGAFVKDPFDNNIEAVFHDPNPKE